MFSTMLPIDATEASSVVTDSVCDHVEQLWARELEKRAIEKQKEVRLNHFSVSQMRRFHL